MERAEQRGRGRYYRTKRRRADNKQAGASSEAGTKSGEDVHGDMKCGGGDMKWKKKEKGEKAEK
eukprot:6191749-Pleurochrysis_carterae.AAC.1